MVHLSAKIYLRLCNSMKRSAASMVESALPKEDNTAKVSRTTVNHYADDATQEMSVFKKMFKQYKRRQPPPDLSSVIKTTESNEEFGVSSRSLGLNDDIVSEEEAKLYGIRPPSEWSVTTIKGREGLYILPQILREDRHLEWLQRTFQYAEPPNTTNMTAHGNQPGKDVLKEAGKNLRWTTLGIEYNWDTKEYPLEGRELPRELSGIARLISDALGLVPVEADAAIVNYYPPKATLSPHQDRSERDLARPLVSLSVGQSAVYLTGGTDLNEETIPIWLHSGDALVMYGDQRLVYHGVPCIQKTRTFENDGSFTKELIDYANTSRVNITIRQVNCSL